MHSCAEVTKIVSEPLTCTRSAYKIWLSFLKFGYKYVCSCENFPFEKDTVSTLPDYKFVCSLENSPFEKDTVSTT